MTHIKLSYIFQIILHFFAVFRGSCNLSYHDESRKMNKLYLTKGRYVVSRTICKGEDMVVRGHGLPLDNI